MCWDEPKDPKVYYTLRHVITPEGLLLQTYNNFYVQQNNFAIMSNPRLVSEIQRAQPYYAVELRRDPFGMSDVFGGDMNGVPRVGSPLGN